MASLAPATTGRSRGSPSSAAGAARRRPMTLPARAGGGAIRSSSPAARASSAVIASAGSCSAATATPVSRKATWSQAARSQAAPSTHLRPERGQQACPAQQPDHPALAADRGGGGGRRVAGPPVEPGDRRRQGMAVGRGRDQRRALADDAQGDGSRRAVDGGLRHRDPDAADERRPPGVGVAARRGPAPRRAAARTGRARSPGAARPGTGRRP